MRGRAGLVAARPRFAPLNPSRSSATPLRPCYGARWQGRTNSRTFDAFALRNEKTPGTPGFSNGEGGIRTPGTVSRTQHFQCCTIGRSATSPENSLRNTVPINAKPTPTRHKTIQAQWSSVAAYAIGKEIRLQRLLQRQLSLHVAGQQRLLALLQQQRPTADALTDGIPRSNAAR